MRRSMSRSEFLKMKRRWIRKAIITTDALAAGGKLPPQLASKFIDYVVDVTKLNKIARVVRFSPETLDIPKIGVGNRVTVPAAEASDPGVRRGVTTSKVTLTPNELMTPFEISDTFEEINIELADVEDHIVRMMSTQTGNDVEETVIHGNALGKAVIQGDIISGGDTARYIKDSLHALQDGWLKRARSGHVVDAALEPVGATLFSLMIRNLPSKFRRNRAALRFIMSDDTEQMYREKFSTRETLGGDSALNSAAPLSPFGIPIIGVPLWDSSPRTVEHVTLNGTTAVQLPFAPISNVVVTVSTLDSNPASAYISGTDYTVNLSAGTIVRIGTGAITDGQVVKVTYDTNPQIILTHESNLIVGIGRDVRIERDRDIFRRAAQYAITTKVANQMEEVDALVLAKNVKATI